MKKIFMVLWMVIALSFAAPTTAEPSRFDTVPQMIEDFADYEAASNSFAVLKEKPLHIRLSPVVVASDPPEVIDTLNKQALIYGIYRTFIHTHIDQITVTAVPVLPDKKLLTPQRSPHFLLLK